MQQAAAVKAAAIVLLAIASLQFLFLLHAAI
jgi:hypothetical protein